MALIGCVLIPRLELLAAAGGRRELLAEAVAVAPDPGRPQVLGELSGAAEAHGLRRGMPLGEALDRCPGLRLVSADPSRSERAWERQLEALEGIGAEVEPGRPGEAYLGLDAIAELWGGAEPALERARRAVGAGCRVGGGPNRLCARAMAARRPARRRAERRLLVAGAAARRFISTLSVHELAGGPDQGFAEIGIAHELERLGIATLGALAELPDDAVADRFAEAGLAALALSRGAPERLRPRRPRSQVEVSLELPEAASGIQLGRGLAVLVDRLLAHPRRTRRTVRRMRLTARLAGGGSWRIEAWPRSATDSAERLRLALAPRLGELPSPAIELALRATELGAAAGEQATLAPTPAERRRERLGEALEHVRASCGQGALLRIVEIDPESRLPERRIALSPVHADGPREGAPAHRAPGRHL